MKKVCILSRHALFCKGIEALLSQEAGLEITNWGTDYESVIERIKQYSPDVVIVDSDDLAVDIGPAVIYMLREQLGFCVIGVSLRDNRYSICRGENKEIVHLDDLLKAINT